MSVVCVLGAGSRRLDEDFTIGHWLTTSSLTLALALGFATPNVAVAQQVGPAVSGPNWDVGVAGGSRDGDGAYLFDGMYTAPLSYTTGFRIDGAGGATEEGFLGGAAFHYFTRDPSIGLFGGFVSYGSADPNDAVDDQQDLFRVAGESEIYYGDLTVLAIAGGQFSDDVDEGFFGRIDFEWYANDDLMFTAGGEYEPFRDGMLNGGVEFQPNYVTMPGLTLFAEASVADDFDRVFAGARFYFGEPKSLKDRHRSDTFRSGNQATNTAIVPGPTREANSAGDDGGDGGGAIPPECDDEPKYEPKGEMMKIHYNGDECTDLTSVK